MASVRGSAARLAAFAGCAALAVLVGGCGIRPTPVLSADPGPTVVPVVDPSQPQPDSDQPPPVGPVFPPQSPLGVPVYFIDNGALRVVERFDVPPAEPEAGEDPSALIRLGVQELLSGPRVEGAEGALTTALPPQSAPGSVRITLRLPQVLVRFNVAGDQLPLLAQMQISCTVHRAVRRIAPIPDVDMQIRGSDRKYAPLPPCPGLALTAQPLPS